MFKDALRFVYAAIRVRWLRGCTLLHDGTSHVRSARADETVRLQNDDYLLTVCRVQVTDRKSAEYISALWFGDRQSIVMQTYNKLYRSHGGVDDSVPEIPKQAKRRAIQLCEKNAQKRDIDWYLSEVADDMVRPSSDAVVFGLLRVKTGRCGRLLPDTGRVLLENCRPQLYGRPSENMTFQLTRSGHLKVTGKEMASDVRQSCCGDFSRWMDLSDCFPYFL
jgi:hypothetical protein